MRRREELTSKQKAAIMLMVFGPEAAGQVIRHFKEDQIEQLSLEVARSTG